MSQKLTIEFQENKIKIPSILSWKKALEKATAGFGVEITSMKYLDVEGDFMVITEEEEWEEIKKEAKITSFIALTNQKSFSIPQSSIKEPENYVPIYDTKIIENTKKEDEKDWYLFELDNQSVYKVYEKIFVSQENLKIKVIRNERMFSKFKKNLKGKTNTLYYSVPSQANIGEIYQSGIENALFYSSPTKFEKMVIVFLADLTKDEEEHLKQNGCITLPIQSVYPMYEISFK